MTDFIEYTAKGRYYKVYKDDVYVSQHTTEREAAQVCANLLLSDPESSVRYVHEYEVEVGLTDAGITEAQDYTPAVDQPPTIDSTPDPSSFVDGQASTYDFSTHVTDNGVSALTYALSPSIPNGLALDAATGILSLDGVYRGQGHDTAFTLTVSNDTYTAESDQFNIVVRTVTIASIPSVSVAVGSSTNLVSSYVTDPYGLVTTSDIPGLNATYATYTHAGGLVGVSENAGLSGLTLDVIFDGVTISSNPFEAQITVSDANLTWTGDFETGDLSQFTKHMEGEGTRSTANVVTSPTRGGSYAAEMVVLNNVSSAKNRSELKTKQTGEGVGQKNPGIMRFIWDGPEYWVGFSHYFTEYPEPDVWTFFQIHAPDTTDPNCRRSGGAVHLWEKSNHQIGLSVLRNANNTPNQVAPGAVPDPAGGAFTGNAWVSEWPLVLNEWTDYICNIKISTQGDGFVKFWKNGVLMHEEYNMYNCFWKDQCGVEIANDPRHNGLHTGIYCGSGSGYRRVYVDECRIAEGGSGGYSLVDPVAYRGPR